MKRKIMMFIFSMFILLWGCKNWGTGALFDQIDSQIINSDMRIKASFEMINFKGKRPLTVSFKSTSLGRIDSLAWDFDGDGKIDSTEPDPTYTFYESGDYKANLTVNNAIGESDQSSSDNFIIVEELIDPRVITEFNKHPYIIAHGDINGDGALDVVSLDNAVNGLLWYPNLINSSGEFGLPVKIREDDRSLYKGEMDTDGVGYVAVGDLDGDGDQDILSISFFARGEIISGAETYGLLQLLFSAASDPLVLDQLYKDVETYLVWWENIDTTTTPGSGNGEHWARHYLSDKVFFYPATLKIVDLDDDGDLDVLGGARYDLRLFDVWTYWQNSRGNEWPAKIVPEKEGLTNKICWWENTGDKDHWIEHEVFSFSGGVLGLQVEDVDHDGNLDIFSAATLDSRGIGWLKIEGNYSDPNQVWTFNPISPGIYMSTTFCAGDYDLNGTIDLAVSRWSSSDIDFYMGEVKEGAFEIEWVKTKWTGNFSKVHCITRCDLDLDGDMDLLLGSQETSSIRWLENITHSGGFMTSSNEPLWNNRVISYHYNSPTTVLGVSLDTDLYPELLTSSIDGEGGIHWWDLSTIPGTR